MIPYYIPRNMHTLRCVLVSIRSWGISALQWRHNERDGISNHRRIDCLLNRLFRRRSKKTSKLRVTDLCVGIHRWRVNSPHKWSVTLKMFLFDDVIMWPKFDNIGLKIWHQLSFCKNVVPLLNYIVSKIENIPPIRKLSKIKKGITFVECLS